MGRKKVSKAMKFRKDMFRLVLDRNFYILGAVIVTAFHGWLVGLLLAFSWTVVVLYYTLFKSISLEKK